jgi:hypothetical protein
LLLVIAAIALGIVGVAAKGLLYLLIIGIAVFLAALILAALRCGAGPAGVRPGRSPGSPASLGWRHDHGSRGSVHSPPSSRSATRARDADMREPGTTGFQPTPGGKLIGVWDDATFADITIGPTRLTPFRTPTS